MAKLSKIIKIKQADYSTLLSEGQVTINDVTHVYDPDALYTITDPADPEYAERAGYAASAGTSEVAIKDASGNNIVNTYLRKDEQVSVSQTATPGVTTIAVNSSVRTVVSADEPLGSEHEYIAPSWSAMQAALRELNEWEQVLVEAVAKLTYEIAGLKASLENLGRVRAEALELTDMLKVAGGDFITVGDGAPTSMPYFIGQIYFDKTGKALYVAGSVTNNATGWQKAV